MVVVVEVCDCCLVRARHEAMEVQVRQLEQDVRIRTWRHERGVSADRAGVEHSRLAVLVEDNALGQWDLGFAIL